MKSVAVVLLSVAIGCGGTGKDGPTTPNGNGSGSAGAKPAAAGDVQLDIPVIKVEGVIFEPEALGRPGMPTTRPKGVSLDKQRTIFANEKNILVKQARAAELATLLLDDAKKKSGDDAKKDILEARQALRDVTQLAKAQVDELALRMLGSYEIEALVMHKDGDWGIAEKVWEQLVTKFPKTKDVAGNKAWWAYTLLKQYKNDEALNVVKNETLSAKEPELAYVTAWAKWRKGDDAGAWQAIVLAAEGWPSGDKGAIQRDLLLFAGRSNVPFTQTAPELYKVFGAKDNAAKYEIVAKLALQAYQFAGKWQEGVAAIEEALKLGGTAVPPNDLLALKYYAADFTVRLDQASAAARFALDAIKGMPGCAEPKPCTKQDKQNMVTGIYGIARVFHLLYATANDIRYYQPAHDLYVEVIPLIQDTAQRTQAKSDLDTLEKTLKNTKAGSGTHEKQAIGVLLQRRTQEIQACYEETLAANPKLGGTLTLTLESDASGDIKGAASEPKGGAADLPLVASCAVAAAKTWKLPKRGMAGNTRIKLVYQLSKK